jgi:opacity protein-like surface antigen
MRLISQTILKIRTALLLIAALALTFMTSAAFAQGFSVGASVGSSKIEVSEAGISFDGSDVGWKVFGKYMFNDNWGVELGFVDFGNPDDSIFGIPIDIEADGIDAFFIGSFPASDSFDLFGKLGYVAWDAKISSPGVPSESDDGSDLALGIGAAFHTSDTFSILGEWEWFDISDTDTVWMLSIGIQVGFN